MKCEIEGDWEEISEASDKISDTLEDNINNNSVDDDTLDEWEEWEPEEDDSDSEMKEKTVEHQSMDVTIDGHMQDYIKKAVCELEKCIYGMMLLHNPFYFNAENITVSLEEGDENYTLKFYSRDEQVKEDLWNRI